MRAYARTMKDLGTDCWSAIRGRCQGCKRVSVCKLPEAKKGRLVLAEGKVALCKRELAEAEKRYKGELAKAEKQLEELENAERRNESAE